MKSSFLHSGSCSSGSSHPAEPQGLLITSEHSTPMLPCPPLPQLSSLLCCGFYFIGLYLIHSLVLHLHVSEELQCQWDKAEWSGHREDRVWGGTAGSRVCRGQVVLRNLSPARSLSAKPRRSPGSFLQDLLVAAGHHSDVGRDYFADLRDGGSCMLGKSGPIPSCCIVIFRKSIYQQLLQPLDKKRAVFLPSNKSECSIGTTYIYFYTW